MKTILTPVTPVTFTGTRLAMVSYDYGSALSAKSIVTELEVMTDSEDFADSITAILGTSVA